jgi:splicing factor 3A subunit 3
MADLTNDGVVPPPPPPPPPQPSTTEYGKADPALVGTITSACSLLEEIRCLGAEQEGSLLFSSSLFGHPPGMGGSVDASNLPGALQDAWAALSEQSSGDANKKPQKSLLEASKDDPAEFPLGRGQIGKMLHSAALAACLKRSVAVSNKLKQKEETTTIVLKKATTMKDASSEALLAVFDDQLQQLRQYHVRHPESAGARGSKRQKVGHPIADGYDLSSMVATELKQYREALFTTEEVMGKYFDLQALHEQAIAVSSSSWKDVIPADLIDFLHLLSKGLGTSIKEADKLDERKKYLRFLSMLQQYLESFLHRSNPLLSLKEDVLDPAIKDFEAQWRTTGGIEGWEHKMSEASWAGLNGGGENERTNMDLSPFKTAEDLHRAVDGDVLKTELSKLGLKCGGTTLDRAKRLFMTKDTPLDKLPKKLFAKNSNSGTQNGHSNGGRSSTGERRVDLARQEVIVTALLNQLRPTLEATVRRAERRQAQTVKEREQELEEELYGSELALPDQKKTGDDDDSDEDDDDAPIYNPKGVPLGWDGKPIPYWLFKLHGLNHFYPCEICGGESYRGRRNFEKHFAEAKHAYGMKCLGIPNTNHFHGVTTIEDAQELWKRLEGSLNKERFDGAKDEEYEDSHGNVLSRTNYEDLARQGLL